MLTNNFYTTLSFLFGSISKVMLIVGGRHSLSPTISINLIQRPLFKSKSMNSSEEILQTAGETFEYANQYVQKQIDLLKLDSAAKIAKSTSAIITLAVIGFLATMVMIMLSITIGFALGETLGSYALAFLIITGVYALIALVVYFFKRQLVTNPVLSTVLASFFD